MSSDNIESAVLALKHLPCGFYYYYYYHHIHTSTGAQGYNGGRGVKGNNINVQKIR